MNFNKNISGPEKIYIEPTNHCNLKCSTCIRNTWEHEFIEISINRFRSLAQEFKSIPTLKSIMFSGFGEPLCHDSIWEMIKLCKSASLNVEMISNGLLLNDVMCKDLVLSGLNTIWISIDGASAKNYEEIRIGASHNDLITNLIRLKAYIKDYKSDLKLGISFVAMKSNIHELPEIKELGKKLGASFLKVTNVIPYTRDMVSEALYNLTLTQGEIPNPDKIVVDLPAMDNLPNVAESLDRIKKDSDVVIHNMGVDSSIKYNYCKFVKENCVVIGADGRVAPCLSLLYKNKTFLNNYEREINPLSYGNINDSKLTEIWFNKDYADFRDKVDNFGFSPCTSCGGCERLESNSEDCFGNKPTVCGGCLWAQGIVQCP